MAEGDLLWKPSPDWIERSRLTHYMRWLDRGLESYDDLWRWSVDDLDAFWASLWEYFELPGGYDRVLASREMPGAEWFPGAELNYAEQLFRRARGGETAVVHASELRELAELSWDELIDMTARVATE